jgi:D-3-phosphoglycerate dehydrogenase
MHHRALVLAPFSSSQLKALKGIADADYESWLDTRKLYDPEELAQRLNGDNISILLVESDFVFEETFAQAPGLKFVGVCRATTNHVDIEAATRHGVLVVNTPGRNAQAVAEHVLGAMLSLARHITDAHRYVKEGRWADPVEPYAVFRGTELAGRTLGIVGLGAIGRRLAHIATCLDMRVLAYDPYANGSPDGVRMADLHALLVEADFVATLAPLNAETTGMLDARRLSLMKPSALLITASGAAIADQDALVQALAAKRIAGAAIDVFDTHPVASDSPFLALDNALLTPHIGGATVESIERHSRMMLDDIRRFVSGQRPVNLVNPVVWERRG